MRLAEDLFLLFKSVACGAFPPFFDIVAQNIPYHSTKLFVICTIPSLVNFRDLAKPLSACSIKRLSNLFCNFRISLQFSYQFAIFILSLASKCRSLVFFIFFTSHIAGHQFNSRKSAPSPAGTYRLRGGEYKDPITPPCGILLCHKPPSYVLYKGTYVSYDYRTNVLLARLTKVRC